MPELAIVNAELGCIEVTSRGDVTTEELHRVLKDIEALAKQSGINKVLVDTTEEETIPLAYKLYDFGTAISDFLQVAVTV